MMMMDVLIFVVVCIVEEVIDFKCCMGFFMFLIVFLKYMVWLNIFLVFVVIFWMVVIVLMGYNFCKVLVLSMILFVLFRIVLVILVVLVWVGWGLFIMEFIICVMMEVFFVMLYFCSVIFWNKNIFLGGRLILRLLWDRMILLVFCKILLKCVNFL